MSFTKRGENTHVVAAATGTNNLSLPGPPQTGDIVVVACACDFALPAVGGSIGVNAASGYTNAGWPNSAQVGLQVGVKVMGGTPDTTVGVVSRSGDNRSIVVTIQVWAGGNATSPQDATAQTASNTSGTPDAPSFTTATPGALVIAVGAADDQNSAASITAPSGYGDLVAKDASVPIATESVTLAMASIVKATEGAEDPGGFGGASSANWAAVTLALRPKDIASSAAQTLSAISQSGSGAMTAAATSTGAQTAVGPVQAGSATTPESGTSSAAQTLTALAQAGSLIDIWPGALLDEGGLPVLDENGLQITDPDILTAVTAAQTLPAFTQQGVLSPEAAGAQTIEGLAQAASAAEELQAAGAQTATAPTQTAFSTTGTGLPIAAQTLGILAQQAALAVVGGGMPLWPLDLPQSPLLGSTRISFEEMRVVFEPDVGPPIIRRDRVGAGEFVTMTFLMSDAELVSFRAFWRSTTAQGSGNFVIAHPITAMARTARFTDPYRLSRRIRDVNLVTVVLYVKPE